jgi:ABC-2 type transport system permease protein
VHRYDDVAAGEEAVRHREVDVLVVDGQRLLWRGLPDEQLRALLTGAIQLVAVQDRAAEAGIGADELAALAAPVPVANEELGIVGGRSPDDEAAAYITSVLLLIAMATYGQLVLTGVVQEKSSRVVEVLLARMPARNLLAGKVTGIGLLGLGQFVLTALAALVATLVVDDVDIPAVSGPVLASVVAWFVLGYAMYAMSYGALGSLASRTEDASSISAPVTTVLIVGYWASFLAVGGDPESGWARAVSLFPPTAPFAMPARIALGATSWWEPAVAMVLTLATVAALVVLAGRVYTGAILHGGPTLKLRDAWSRSPATAPPSLPPPPAAPTRPGAAATTGRTLDGRAVALLAVVATAVGAAVYAATRDVIMAVAAGAGSFTVASRWARSRARKRPDPGEDEGGRPAGGGPPVSAGPARR